MLRKDHLLPKLIGRNSKPIIDYKKTKKYFDWSTILLILSYSLLLKLLKDRLICIHTTLFYDK